MKALLVTQDKMRVSTLGYYSPGDGGGNDYYFDASSLATDNGGSVISPNIGSGRFVSVERSNVNVLQWGAKRDFDLSTWSGTDNTSRFQAAIDFAESNPSIGIPDIFVPAGAYGVNSITLKYASMNGAGAGTDRYWLSSMLCQISGATNDMVVMDVEVAGVFVQPARFNGIKNMTLYGSRERNLKNPKTIVSASSRTVFTVSTNDVPPTPSDSGGFPYFGFCFFFSNENRFLGHGMVRSVSTNTGAITLEPGWDNYATLSGSGGLLSSGFKVCFAGIGTKGEYQPNRSDSTAAGYSAVQMLGSGFKRFEDLNIIGFHTGFRVGSAIVLETKNVWGLSISLGLLSQVWLDVGADDGHLRYFNQGLYYPDLGLSAETNSIADSSYRRGAFGMYGIRGRSQITQFTSDGNVYGLLQYSGYQQTFSQTLIDYPVKAAIVSILGSTRSTGIQMGDFQVTSFRGTLPQYITYNGSGAREAIVSLGLVNTNRIEFTSFSTIAYVGQPATNNWDSLFYATNNSAVNVLKLIPGTGYNSISSAGFYPRIGSVASDLLDASALRWGVFRQSNEVVSLISNGSVGLSVSTATTNALPTIGIRNPPAIIGQVDTLGRELSYGTDESSSGTRTDLSNKAFRITGVPYTLSQPNFSVIGGTADSANNIVFHGGGSGGQQSATDHRFYAASSQNTLTGTFVGRINTGGMIIGPSGISGNIDASLLFEPRSTVKGMLAGPKMTTVQSDAITSPVSGLQVYDTTVNKVRTFDGTRYRYGELYLSGSTTWDVPSTAAGGEQGTTVSVTGAVIGDLIVVAPARIAQSFFVTGVVLTNGVVSLYAINASTGTIDPASANYTVHVLKP